MSRILDSNITAWVIAGGNWALAIIYALLGKWFWAALLIGLGVMVIASHATMVRSKRELEEARAFHERMRQRYYDQFGQWP